MFPLQAVLSKLRDRAVRVYAQSAPPQPSPGLALDQPDDNTTDELAIFGGQTRVVALKQKQKHRRAKSVSTAGSVSPPSVGAANVGVVETDFTPPPEAYPDAGFASRMGSSAPQAGEEFPWLAELVALTNTTPPSAVRLSLLLCTSG
jgi:hypothetical protein